MPQKNPAVNPAPTADGDALDRLAAQKRLDPQKLRDWGVRAGPMKPPHYVEALIPYYDDSNAELMFTRERRNPPERLADKVRRFYQPKGIELSPYGLWHLEKFRRGVTLHVVEGETDSWAMWSAGISALGIPGSAYRCMTLEHTVGFETIYVHQESDKAGVLFADGIVKHLKDIGFPGNVCVATMPECCKDIGDVYARDPDGFRDAIADMEADARLILTRAPPQDEANANEAQAEADEKPPTGFRWAPLSSAELYAIDRRPTWLVKGILVAGQPAVIGAPHKCYKTSTAIDLAVSLATATPFLGRFAIEKTRRVALISGESGDWTIGETNRRVCEVRGIDHTSVGVSWMFDLPRLSSETELKTLCEGIRADGIEVVVLDPLYLCLMGGDKPVKPENVYEIGPLLLSVARACLRAGATPILCHHTRKGSSAGRQPPELGDLAYAGIAEFARQWLLLGWREDFDPEGPRKLWLGAGGSCGQGGLWAMDIDEGKMDDDFGGRTWSVELRSPAEDREGKRSDSAADKAESATKKECENDRRYLEALERLEQGQGVAHQRIVEATSMSGTAANKTLERLVKREILEEIPGFTAKIGSGAVKPSKGVRRCEKDVFEGE